MSSERDTTGDEDSSGVLSLRQGRKPAQTRWRGKRKSTNATEGLLAWPRLDMEYHAMVAARQGKTKTKCKKQKIGVVGRQVNGPCSVQSARKERGSVWWWECGGLVLVGRPLKERGWLGFQSRSSLRGAARAGELGQWFVYPTRILARDLDLVTATTTHTNW